MTKEALLSCQYDVVRCNFPNPDMVGHTGKLEATIVACAAADAGVKVRRACMPARGGGKRVGLGGGGSTGW